MVTRQDFQLPPLDNNGDQSANPIFTSVGYALSTWEHAEEMLASLFAYLTNPKGANHSAFRAYGTLTATQPRKNMILASAEIFFGNFKNDDLSSRLSQLLTIYGDAGARRNEIAHGTVMSGPLGPNTPVRWFLVPALHSTKKTNERLEAEYRFNSSTIDRFQNAFDGFTADILQFRNDLTTFYVGLPVEVREPY